MSSLLLGSLITYLVLGVIIAHVVFITPQRKGGTSFSRAYNNVKAQGLTSEYALCVFAWLPFVIYVLSQSE